jgi:hypothetical protein
MADIHAGSGYKENHIYLSDRVKRFCGLSRGVK